MTVDVSSEIQPADLDRLVSVVFQTMLELEVVPCDEVWSSTGDRLTAVVHMTGAWQGALQVECDPHHACCLAGRLMAMDPPESVDDDVRDVIGELANVIAGNLKGLLPDGIELSAPSVVDGNNYTVRLCHISTKCQYSYKSEDGVFWVTVLRSRS